MAGEDVGGATFGFEGGDDRSGDGGGGNGEGDERKESQRGIAWQRGEERSYLGRRASL